MSKSYVWSVVVCGCCGVGDGLTGVGLMLAPGWILKVMLIHPLPDDLFMFRWIGAFACGVGIAYLSPYLEPPGALRVGTLRTVFRVTAVIRILISAVVVAGIASGQLVFAWISIPFYDGTFAVIQILLLKRELRVGNHSAV